MFIPTYMTQPTDDAGYKAEVLLPDTVPTTNRILVHVTGEVVSPGQFSVPEGCTVLQAVAHAGGFTPSARVGRMVVHTDQGYKYRLRLRLKNVRRHRQVWCELISAYPPDQLNSRASQSPETDFILHNKDACNVPRAVW